MASTSEPAQTISYESHLLPAFAILAVLLLLEILPGRLQIVPVVFLPHRGRRPHADGGRRRGPGQSGVDAR